MLALFRYILEDGIVRHKDTDVIDETTDFRADEEITNGRSIGHNLFFLYEMTQKKSDGEGHAGADQNILQGVAHFLSPRTLAELFKEGILIGSGKGLGTFPFADSDGVNTSQLRKLDLV